MDMEKSIDGSVMKAWKIWKVSLGLSFLRVYWYKWACSILFQGLEWDKRVPYLFYLVPICSVLFRPVHRTKRTLDDSSDKYFAVHLYNWRKQFCGMQMERSIADELYSEILKPKVELSETSVPDIKESNAPGINLRMAFCLFILVGNECIRWSCMIVTNLQGNTT